MIEVKGAVTGQVYARIFKTYHPDGLYEAYIEGGSSASGLKSFGDAKLFVEKQLRGKRLVYKTSQDRQDFLQPDSYKWYGETANQVRKFVDFGERRRFEGYKLSEQTRKVGSNMQRGYSKFGALVELAVKGDEFQKQNGVENAVVREAMELHKKQQREAVAQEIVSAMQLVEQNKDALIVQIRDARRMEAAAKRKLDLIDKAVAFGNKTGNFCPVLRLMGVQVPDENVPQELRLS